MCVLFSRLVDLILSLNVRICSCGLHKKINEWALKKNLYSISQIDYCDGISYAEHFGMMPL